MNSAVNGSTKIVWIPFLLNGGKNIQCNGFVPIVNVISNVVINVVTTMTVSQAAEIY